MVIRTAVVGSSSGMACVSVGRIVAAPVRCRCGAGAVLAVRAVRPLVALLLLLLLLLVLRRVPRNKLMVRLRRRIVVAWRIRHGPRPRSSSSPSSSSRSRARSMHVPHQALLLPRRFLRRIRLDARRRDGHAAAAFLAQGSRGRAVTSSRRSRHCIRGRRASNRGGHGVLLTVRITG
jgi:hypothetical protein